MILSGKQIVAAREQGDIVIEPFVAEHVNPNSYTFRLGATLREYRCETLDPRAENDYVERTTGPEGFVPEPGRLYLAQSVERLGGTVYAPTFAARSSIVRHGLFINLSAPLGDIGFIGQWTLQLYCAQPLRVYTGMPIGQMMWWKAVGDVELYHGKYQDSAGPRTSATSTWTSWPPKGVPCYRASAPTSRSPTSDRSSQRSPGSRRTSRCRTPSPSRRRDNAAAVN